MKGRLQRLRGEIADHGLDALLISQPENRRYLSGFTGSAGFLLVTESTAFLATDFRYTEQAQKQAPDFDVHRIEGEMQTWLPPLMSGVPGRKVGFEANGVTFHTYRQMAGAVGDKDLVPTEGLVENLRAVKDRGELDLILRAVEISDAAIEQVTATIRAGITEKDVAWQLERLMREMGSEPIPFDIIVAAGPNAALAHHSPSDHPIGEGEPLVIDMGARVGGYSSDLTRTICLGERDQFFDTIYNTVLDAQRAAFTGVTAGMSGDQADALARRVIEDAGHGEHFGHGLGHGVGLAPHESPRLGKLSSDVLVDWMVFTIEPGIYVSGWGGVRIEDVVVMEGGRPRLLSNAAKMA